MKKGDIWMPFYIADYLANTARLTTVQHGAYLLLIMEYWIHGPLPDDNRKLCQITKMPFIAFKKSRQQLSEFFSVVDGFWIHKRIEEEKRKTAQLIEKYKERSKAGNDAKRAKGILKGVLEGDQKDTLEAPPLPSPLPKTIKTKSRTTPSAQQVALPGWLSEQVWNAWLQHRKDCKKPLTQHAGKLSIAKLEALRLEGHQPEDVIAQSIVSGWTGLFPITEMRQKNYASKADEQKSFFDGIVTEHEQRRIRTINPLAGQSDSEGLD